MLAACHDGDKPGNQGNLFRVKHTELADAG
jgi:hypothetical protein